MCGFPFVSSQVYIHREIRHPPATAKPLELLDPGQRPGPCSKTCNIYMQPLALREAGREKPAPRLPWKGIWTLHVLKTCLQKLTGIFLVCNTCNSVKAKWWTQRNVGTLCAFYLPYQGKPLTWNASLSLPTCHSENSLLTDFSFSKQLIWFAWRTRGRLRASWQSLSPNW